MEDHQINVVRQLVMENFTPTPLKVINQKSVLLSIVAYSSLYADQLLQLGGDLTRVKARAAQMSDKGDIDVGMIMSSQIAGFGQVFFYHGKLQGRHQCKVDIEPVGWYRANHS